MFENIFAHGCENARSVFAQKIHTPPEIHSGVMEGFACDHKIVKSIQSNFLSIFLLQPDVKLNHPLILCFHVYTHSQIQMTRHRVYIKIAMKLNLTENGALVNSPQCSFLSDFFEFYVQENRVLVPSILPTIKIQKKRNSRSVYSKLSSI